jgi:hypothetical protein
MCADKLQIKRYTLTDDVERRIMEFIKCHSREYVFCGEVAVHMHNNLSWTSWALEELVIRGKIRCMTCDEKKKAYLDKDAQVFIYIHTEQK